MRVVLFHISDLHIEKGKDIKVINVEKIVDVLNGIGKFDDVIIVVSGDIANAGKKEQYQAAYYMFGNIVSKIKRNFGIAKVNMYVVPGNHDVNLDKDEGHKIIQEKIKSGVSDEMINRELEKQKAFYNYAKGVHSINLEDPLVCIKEQTYGDKKMQICLLNTALFSTRDEDKGLHYLPDTVLEKIKELNGDINISVLHHSHHWMHESLKRKVEDILIEKNSVILCGHEHGVDSSEIRKKGAQVICLTGGELCNKGNWSKSQFYLDIIDTENMIMTSIAYKWNEQTNIYAEEDRGQYSLVNMSISNEFEFAEEFEENLRIDPINSISKNVFDYYVFPDLEVIKDYSSKEIEMVTNIEDFFKNIIESGRVAITGGESAGKTLLLKKIYQELNRNKYCALYCDAIELKNVSIQNALLHMYRKNYKEKNGGFDRFLQLPKMKRVVLLDNVQDIDKNQLLVLLKWLQDYFGIIVYSTKELIELDMTERVKISAELGEYTRYKILPMYTRKREELISNIVNIKEDDDNKDELCRRIATAIKEQRKIYSMNPSFVIQFVEYYLKNFKDACSTDGNIFSKVFENNIINRIRPVAKRLTVDKILVLLDKIAYWCFKEQKSEIGQEHICNIVVEYNAIQDDEVQFLELLEACLKARILRKTKFGGKYRFADKNILSYFVARELIRIWNDNLDDNDLKNLIKYVRYGINSNIILFVTYLTDNLYLIRSIIDSTLNYAESWISFNAVDVNVPYLAVMQGLEVAAPTSQDRVKNEREEEQLDKDEIKEYENNQIIVKDYFDTQVDDCEIISNQIIRSVTLLDVASKCLPGFEHRMNKKDKEKITRIIYELPGKIFYMWAEQVEKEKDALLKYLLEEYKSVYLKPREWDSVTEKDMLRYLQSESLSLLLELLNMPISNAAKDYTIRYLANNVKQDEVLNLIQILMAYCKLDMVSEFSSTIKTMENYLKKCIPDYMAKRVLHRFLITSKKISNDKIQSLTGTYFPTKKTNNIFRNILISREKNQKKQ